MKKILLLVLIVVVSLSCSKRVGQYNVYLNGSERRALSRAVKDSVKASFLIDTLAKTHRGLSKQRVVTRVDTVYQEAAQQTKEINAKARYSPEEVERIKSQFQTRIWTLLDSFKMSLDDRNGFVKTIAREAIPLLESGKVNTDTVKIDEGSYHFRAFMHKGKLVADVKKDRTAISIHNQVAETNITPVVNCPPEKKWLKFWETWVALGGISVLLIVLFGFVRSALSRR